MTGVVNADLEPIIRLNVESSQSSRREIEAIIDTGFSGFLTLPFELVESMGLPWLCRQEGILADGRVEIFDVYTATVIWDGTERKIELDAVNGKPLIGMSMMENHSL